MSNRYKTAEPAGRSKKNADRYSRRSRRNRVGTFFLVVQALMSVAFMGVVLLLNMLPVKYLAMVALILFFLWCISFTTQAVRRGRGITGKLYSLLIIISCISGCLYFWGIYVVPAVVVCVVCQLSIVLIWGKLKNHAHGCTSTVWERTEHMVGINVPISSRIGKKNVKGTMFLICAKQTLISCDFVRKSG